MFSSLRTKLIVMSVTIVGLSMTAMTISNIWTVKNDTIAVIDHQVSLLANSYTYTIGQWVTDKHVALNSLSPFTAEADPRPFISNTKSAGGFDETYIGYPDGRYVGLQALPGLNTTTRPWYKEAIAEKKFILTSPYIDAITGNLVISFAKAIYGAGGTQETAVIGADMQLANVVESVKKIRPTPKSYALIFNEEGLIITHPNREWQLKQASKLIYSPEIKDIIALAEKKSASVLPIENVIAMLYVRKIPGTNWYLTVVVDYDEATAPIWRALKISIFTSFVAILFAAALMSVSIGRVTRRLLVIRDAMKDVVSGEGDLTRRLTMEGRDELAQVSIAFNSFVDKISAILIEIRSASQILKVSSADIASGSSDLSKLTGQQASSLEETNAAMEELTLTVRQNAESARNANLQAVSASEVAAQGGLVVGQVVETMESISASSHKIVEIISVINSIAFQTNILALNAAVEAARAGEQGRGFAVVASEVRSLAQRSATAAKEIKDLIDDSASAVDAGSKLVKKAGETMADVVSSVKSVTAIVGEISVASQGQSQGIEEIGQSIADMEQMTQKNAALLEDASAGAHSLQEQASGLAKTVGVFKLDDASAHMKVPVATPPSSATPIKKSDKTAPVITQQDDVAARSVQPLITPKRTASKNTPARFSDLLSDDTDWEEH